MKTIRDKLNTIFRVVRSTGLMGVIQLTADKFGFGSNDNRPPLVNNGGRGLVGLIDVGSVGGLPAEWRRHKSSIHFLLNFEPRDNPIITNNVVTMNTALWSNSCDRNFYIYKGFHGSGSSLFEQNYEYVRVNWETLRLRGPRQLAESWFERSELVRIEKLKTRTLDEVISLVNPDAPLHFLKIDAQGAELEILKGAERFLTSQCLGLCLELFVVPLYKGIQLLPEVENYLEKRGFYLAKKFPAHGSFDSQHDCLFLKKGVSTPEVDIIRVVYGV